MGRSPVGWWDGEKRGSSEGRRRSAAMGRCWLALEGPGDTLGGGTSPSGDSQVDVLGLFECCQQGEMGCWVLCNIPWALTRVRSCELGLGQHRRGQDQAHLQQRGKLQGQCPSEASPA